MGFVSKNWALETTSWSLGGANGHWGNGHWGNGHWGMLIHVISRIRSEPMGRQKWIASGDLAIPVSDLLKSLDPAREAEKGNLTFPAHHVTALSSVRLRLFTFVYQFF